jgi:small GTP-binding protein
MELSEKDYPIGSAGALIVQLLLKNYGGFAVYRMSVIVANMVSRALIGRGLVFAANATLVRAVGLVIGPIGWIASGLWLAYDLAGPAFRKTVPAVVHVAMLRQMLMNRVSIGVVGDGSTGKDALFRAVFGLDTGNVHPVAGSTKYTRIYDLGKTGAVQAVNFPGFDDFREDVNEHARDMLRYIDVLILVIDISRGVSGADVEVLRKMRELGHPILVCLNKRDLPRPSDLPELLNAARERLSEAEMVDTAFDPDSRLRPSGPNGEEPPPENCSLVYNWVIQEVAKAGKETSHIPKSEYV